MGKSNRIEMDYRGMRAKQFASQILHTLQDYLPTDGRTKQRIYEHLFETAHAQNALIVSVPPEFDLLSKMESEREINKRMLEPFVMNFGDVKP